MYPRNSIFKFCDIGCIDDLEKICDKTALKKLLLVPEDNPIEDDCYALDGGFGNNFTTKICVEVVKNGTSIFVPTGPMIQIYQMKNFINPSVIDTNLIPLKIGTKGNLSGSDKFYVNACELSASFGETQMKEVLVYQPQNNTIKLTKMFVFTNNSRNFAMEASNNKLAHSSHPRCVGNMCLDVEMLSPRHDGYYYHDNDKKRFNMLLCEMKSSSSSPEPVRVTHSFVELLEPEDTLMIERICNSMVTLDKESLCKFSLTNPRQIYFLAQ